MNLGKYKHILFSAATGSLLLAGLLLVLNGTIHMAHAEPGILYVAPGGNCGGMTPCYATIQAAVNAANDGDEIRVAAGTYTGVAPAVINSNTYTQVVVITRTLTLQGGYATTDWGSANPAANPTIVDAQRQGRAISILGDGSQTVTVAGFTLTGGDYTGLGNPPRVANQVCGRTGSDCGGGLFAYRVTLLLRDNVITDNIASRTTTSSDGGGAYLWRLNGGSRIENTTFISNTTQGWGGEGGGLCIRYGGAITIANSSFRRNEAHREGGGLFMFQPKGEVLIEDTTFISNTSSTAEGGGLEARLTFDGVALRLEQVVFRDNQAQGQAAALSLIKQSSGTTTVELTNVLLGGNHLGAGGSYGAVVNALGGSAGDMVLLMKHLTWADHASLAAMRLETSYDKPITATLTNTLIASAASAYVGDQEETGDVVIQHSNTLTHDVTSLHVTEAGTPSFQAVNPLSGNPRLDGTYHLQAGSAAIDAGVDAGVTDDIDGDARPVGALPDVGADEFIPHIYLPLVLKW